MKREKYSHTDSVTREILDKGKDVIKDFDDSQEIYVEPKQLKSKLISIRLPMVMISNLRIVARQRGDIGYQQIIKTYIAEGLVRDNQNIKWNIPQVPIALVSNTFDTSSSLDVKFPYNENEAMTGDLLMFK